MDNDILRHTTKHFDTINFSEMSERWIDEAIGSEFTDVEDNDMSIGILFSDDAVQTLLNICRVCDVWVNRAPINDIEESNTGDISSRPEEVLWTYLDEIEISLKQIQGAIYFLCCRAIRSSSSLEEKEIGLLSAKWYFNCLRVPGSSAYSVFYLNLFRVCIECLQVPDHVESKDSPYKWRDFEEILPSVVLALESLVPLLSVFYLGNDVSVVEFVMKKLAELVAIEVSSNKLDFSLDFLTMPEKEKRRRYGYSIVSTTQAYKGFLNLMHYDLNGEKDFIYSFILSQLNHHILCTRVKKAQNIPAKFMIVKDNAVAFICHNLKEKDELCSQLTLTTLKRLCLSVSDKADFRSTVSQSVFTIMFRLCVKDLAHLIQWLLLLADAAETNNRVFALEMLGLLLTNTPQIDTEGLPESMEVYLTPVPVIFTILTRCDDVSPVVRTKALGVISQNMTRALNVLTEMQEPAIFSGEVFQEDYDCEFNGEHRSFWYNMTSFKDMLAEIAGIFHRHIEDTNGIARKAALQALENVITFDLEYLSKENLKLFTMASKDQIIIMRKQTVQSLTVILEKYPDSALSQEYWLRCVLPLVQDPENSVQAKVLNAIEEKFLQNVFSDVDSHRDAAFCLLRKIASGEFLSFQRYLQKAFSLWKADNKLRPQMAAKLERCLGCGNDEMVWFYLSVFAAFSKLPSKMCKLAVEEFEKPLNWESFTFMENILKIISFVFSHLDEDMLGSIRSILMEKLEAYAAPVEILPIMIEILYKIEKHLDNQNEFSEFATKMIQSSVTILSPFVALSKVNIVSSEDLAIKSFTVIKEFCHVFPANITSNLAIILKQFVYPTTFKDNATTTKNVTPTLQAHAFAALGKISLQEENLAREILPLLAKELHHSKEDRIRNNVVIILIEMCKRYTSFADKYIPLISACFKDKRYIIRYQSITLLVGLLQEDYIKCKGTLLYCILSTIVDKKEDIQELGKFCLLQLLYPKNNSIFADHFIDSLFVFNDFPHPENMRLAQIVKQLDRFALPYGAHMEKRMQIYKFMLNFMDFGSKAYIVNALCEEILSSVAGSVFPINRETEWMVRDCFAILSCKEIRAYNSDMVTNDMDENIEEGLANAELSARRVTLILPVIPVVIQLKVCVWDSKSELLTDMVLFLKDLLQDFKSDLNELLKDDKDLLRQVQFEMTNEARQQDREAKAKSRREARKDDKAPEVSTHQTLEQLIQHERNSLGPSIASTSTAGQDVAHASTSGEQGSVRTSRHTLWRSVAANPARDSDVLMDVESGSNGLNQSYLNDPLLSSTPRVVLNKLGKMALPDISRIAMEVDSDSD